MPDEQQIDEQGTRDLEKPSAKDGQEHGLTRSSNRVSELKADESSSFVAVVRAITTSGQRIMALGILAVVGTAILNSLVSIRLLIPLARFDATLLGRGVWGSLLGGMLAQFGLIIILPILAWGFGWLIDEKPFRLTLGAAVFVEVWFSAIAILSLGFVSVFVDITYLLGRLAFVLTSGVIAGFAYSHARRMAHRTDET